MKRKNLLLTAIASLGFAVTTMAQVPSYVPTNGLVGYWPFNGNANDVSGNGNNGTINGATLTTDRNGALNSAYSFNGVNNRIDLPLNLNGSLTNTTEFSISGYVKDFNSGTRGIFSSWKSTASNPKGMLIGMSGNKLGGGTDDGESIITTNTINNSNWVHIVVVFNGNLAGDLNRMKLFVNGIQVASQSATGNTNTVSSNLGNTSTHTAFGAWMGNSGWVGYFSGKLDDFAIWNRALTQQEITTIYNGCSFLSTTQPSSLTASTNSNVVFTAACNVTTATFNWQSNPSNTGWMNLINNTTYSGTNTTSLTVSTIQLSNHKQPFRVVAESGTCKDTSDVVLLHVSDTCIATKLVSVTDTLFIDVNLTGIAAPNNINKVKIYPNPANDHVTLYFGNYTSMSGYTIKIKNNLGQEVYNAPVTQQSEYIDLNGWSGNGIYFVHVIDASSNTLEIKKIILQ